MRKLLICQWFGDLPPWFDRWTLNAAAALKLGGFDVLLDVDEQAFRTRVREVLGVDCPPLVGTTKACDFRPAFGELYALELLDYDWWGHTDLDCVYGRVEKYAPDSLLRTVDVLSNHWSYVSGPFTLYRNHERVNGQFRRVSGWESIMETPETTGWAETTFTDQLDVAHRSGEIRVLYQFDHAYTAVDLGTLEQDDRKLTVEGREVPLAHFRRIKAWPL